MGRRCIQFCDGVLQSRLTLRAAVCDRHRYIDARRVRRCNRVTPDQGGLDELLKSPCCRPQKASLHDAQAASCIDSERTQAAVNCNCLSGLSEYRLPCIIAIVRHSPTRHFGLEMYARLLPFKLFNKATPNGVKKRAAKTKLLRSYETLRTFWARFM